MQTAHDPVDRERIIANHKRYRLGRSNSHSVRLLRLHVPHAGYRYTWASFMKDDGRIVKVDVMATIEGICMAAGFVGTGGRHIS